MPAPLRKDEEDDDLYDDEFDFVDEEEGAGDTFGAGIDLDVPGDDSSSDDAEAKPKPRRKQATRKTSGKADAGDASTPKKAAKKKSAKKKAAKKKAKRVKADAPSEGPEAPPSDAPAHADTPAHADEIAAQPVPDQTTPDGSPAAEAAPEEPAKVEPPKPPTDFIVRVFEYGKLKRTIDREFTEEDAEAYATEYTRTGKAYGLEAQAASKETVDL